MHSTEANIKVSLVCIGRFHLFDLARELEKHGMLDRIVSGYPRWKLTDEGLPQDRIMTFPWLQTPYMGLIRWAGFSESRTAKDLAWLAHESLDRYVAFKKIDSEILFALSGSGLACGKAAQNSGARYVCDRGSTHIRVQNEILTDEFARWGERFHGIDPRVIDKEEAEYAVADAITVPSGFAYRSFLAQGVPEAKLRLVPYGVDLRRFEPVAEPDPDTFNVLFVGRVSFQKGIPDLIEAFRKMKHPRKRLQIVGGMLPEVSRFLSRHPPLEAVEFVGHLPQRELKAVMSRAHVMVLPSVQEGLALVQAQALACGCPVIATVHTGAEDLFADGREGFIVPIRSPEAIAEKLQWLADAPEDRAAMSEAALRRVAELGGWSTYGDRMVEFFSRLVAGTGSHLASSDSDGRRSGVPGPGQPTGVGHVH